MKRGLWLSTAALLAAVSAARADFIALYSGNVGNTYNYTLQFTVGQPGETLRNGDLVTIYDIAPPANIDTVGAAGLTSFETDPGMTPPLLQGAAGLIDSPNLDNVTFIYSGVDLTGAPGATFNWPAQVITIGDFTGTRAGQCAGSTSSSSFTLSDNASIHTTFVPIENVNLGSGFREFTFSEMVGTIVGTSASSALVDAGVTLSSARVTIGTLQINGVHLIRPNTSLTNRTSTLAGLTLAGSPGAWTGLLDLNNNNLIVGSATNTTSFANVQSQIRQAAGTPAPANPWNGTGGITSSAAAAAHTGITKTGLGYASGAEYTALTGATLFDSLTFNTTDTLIKYTLVGDANLDGTVNINDFFALSGHINQPGDWSQGNFNYAGNVTIDDFFVMTGNFGKTLAVGSLLPDSTGGPSAAALAAPEPAAGALLLAGGMLALRRRKRNPRPASAFSGRYPASAAGWPG